MFKFEIETMARAAENLFVVGALVLVPEEQRLHARAGERVLQFMRAIGGVHIDQRSAGPRAAHVQHDPLNAVGGPEADAVAAADAERPEAAGHAVGGIAEFGPGHARGLVARRDGEAVGKAACGAVQGVRRW